MAMLILNHAIEKRMIRQRRLIGADRYDEVWNGVYVMSPDPNSEHQRVSTRLSSAFDQTFEDRPDVAVYGGGINVSDRSEDWTKNYRSPDVAVFLWGNPAIDKGSHVLGGPEFAVEIVSRGDKSRKKFGFYAKVGTRELLIVDRYPWSLELYRLVAGSLRLVAKSTLAQPASLASEILPFTFALIPGDSRPTIEIIRTQDARRWLA